MIPSPFNAANGYEVPDVASLILNYRHGRFAVTPSLHYVDGSNYGSPLVWPGLRAAIVLGAARARRR